MAETFEKGAQPSEPVRNRIPWPQRALTPIASDETLARRAAAGERRAFAAIFRRYHQPLFRYCAAILGNGEDAQDALQNTMVKALRSLPGEERRIQLKPWLYRIAHNESVDLLRRRRETRPLDAELPAAGAGLAEEAATRERLAWLIADLEELPGRQREALLMRELGGLGFEEIGESLGTTAAVARQTLYEARQSLRQMDEGREMSCAEVTRAISDGDGRVLRRRDVRAHLRGCPACRGFKREIEERERDLGALAPLPAVAAAGLLHGILGSGWSSGSGGAAAAVGGGAAKAAGSTAALKGAAAVVAIAALGVAADRGGVVHVGSSGSPRPAAKSAADMPRGGPAPVRAAASGEGLRPGQMRSPQGRLGSGKPLGRSELRAAGPEGSIANGERGAPAVTPAGGAQRENGLGNDGNPGRGPEPEAAAHKHGSSSERGASANPKGHTRGAVSGKPAHPAKPPHPAHPAHPEHPAHPAQPAKPEHAAEPQASGEDGAKATEKESHAGGMAEAEGLEERP